MKEYAFVSVLLLIACAAPAAESTSDAPHRVESRRNAEAEWKTYDAVTVDRIAGFVPAKDELDEYGGLKGSGDGVATGFFRTRKIGDRWWLVDPLGNLFVSKGVATVTAGGASKRKRAAFLKKFGTMEKWLSHETDFLVGNGFNTLGGWSYVPPPATGAVRRIAYTRIVSPMGRFNAWRKKVGLAKPGKGPYEMYPKYVPPVFVPGFDAFVEKDLAPLASTTNDPYLVGIFVDNEIPWLRTMLDNCMRRFDADHPNHRVARAWLDRRRGAVNFPIDSVTEEDRLAFVGFALEVYLRKVTRVLRRIDANHLFLGSRFYRAGAQLENPELFRAAGKYMDVVSVNHYSRWQPDPTEIGNWSRWAGKPFLVTEFYTRGEDTGLLNLSGAGWNVRTQEDRGLFYENFCGELLKDRGCVGWHWFKYMDNDPADLTTDESNRNSNKGILDIEFVPYEPLLRHMKALNDCAYGLIRFRDGASRR